MNIALPALVILLGLLPGIAAFYGYFAGRFEKRNAGVSGVEELALYVVLAIPINMLALSVCRQVGVLFDLDVATHLLVGGLSDSSVNQVVGSLREQLSLTAWTYLFILGGSYAFGSALRRTVWALRLDTFVSSLRLRHRWYYVLLGRDKDLPRHVVAYVDILAIHPDGSRLYRGIVSDFEIGSEGRLESIMLVGARRGQGRGPDFKWVDIPSAQFALMGKMIHSINVTYVGIEEPVNSGPERWKYAFRRFWRSFAFQEP